MTELNYELVQTWAVYLGLFVTTCLTVTSMLFLMHYFFKQMFFWRYREVAKKMFDTLKQVMDANKGPTGNRELRFLAGLMMHVLNPANMSKDVVEQLRLEISSHSAKEE